MNKLGRVSLWVEKYNSMLVPYLVVYKKAIDYPEGGEETQFLDELELIETEHIPLPKEANQMEVGDMICFEADLYGEYTRDYWGEWDSEFEFRNVENLVIYRPINNLEEEENDDGAV